MQPNPLSTSAPGSATFVQAGFARRVRPELSWELGGGCYAYSGANRNRNYCEAFLGAAWREVTARVHYTPDYLNRGACATYMEVNARHALNERIALVGHVGFWHSDGDGRLAALLSLHDRTWRTTTGGQRTAALESSFESL